MGAGTLQRLGSGFQAGKVFTRRKSHDARAMFRKDG